MKITAEPRSDQWNADDFVGGPRTFTVAGVKTGTAEQKYDIELVEGEGRAWRPPLTMLRVLIAAWGDEAAEWAGRRVTLYRDETVRFGSDAVGGIRISHLSHLPGGKRLAIKVTTTRGRRASYTVEPLQESAPPAASAAAAGGGGLSASAREKWQNALSTALVEGDCTERDDQLMVSASLAGRTFDSIPEAPENLTDDELKRAVNTLNDWKKQGVLADRITEVFTAYVAYQSAEQDAAMDDARDAAEAESGVAQ